LADFSPVGLADFPFSSQCLLCEDIFDNILKSFIDFLYKIDCLLRHYLTLKNERDVSLSFLLHAILVQFFFIESCIYLFIRKKAARI